MIQFTLIGISRIRLPKTVRIYYFGRPLELQCPNEKDNKVEIGKVQLTKVGMKLAPKCRSAADPAFYDYVESQFRTRGLIPPKVGTVQRDQLAVEPGASPSRTEADQAGA